MGTDDPHHQTQDSVVGSCIEEARATDSFRSGVVLPMHRHTGDEFLYVIEGSISDESGTTTAGSVGYRPDGCVHSVTSKTGATVFAIISGGIEAGVKSAPRRARKPSC